MAGNPILSVTVKLNSVVEWQKDAFGECSSDF
jgi:hypothetical protein